MKRKKRTHNTNAGVTMLCDDLDFVLHEEYRLLRTNIKYSLSDDKAFHCIGITSSVKGEAKTSTAVNLAYTLAENGEKVCLLEADMRIPTLRKKLNREPHVGLSEYLTAQASAVDIVEYINYEKCTLPVIQAGALPPNPAELLASPRMGHLLTALGKVFTYIIVDLPPVTAVSDAIILGGKLDGVVMVVAQSFCTKRMLRDSMRKLSTARIRVLGFVRTFTSGHGFGYNQTPYTAGSSYHYQGYEYAVQQAIQDKEPTDHLSHLAQEFEYADQLSKAERRSSH